MQARDHKPLQFVVDQHVEECAILRNIRSGLVSAPHVKLHHLRRFDDRLAAHLDGVAVAGEYGWIACRSALESPGAGELFTATVCAIESRGTSELDALLALVQALPESLRGVESAFGWLEPDALQGVVSSLLHSSEPFRQRLGITACALHRLDPGPTLLTAARSPDLALCVRAMRCAAQIGRQDLLAACLELCAQDEPECALWAAWSAALLGNRTRSVVVLREFATSTNRWQTLALALVQAILKPKDAHELLAPMVAEPAQRRAVIRGIGFAGNSYFVPWLIEEMKRDVTARIAGEAFSLITGVDLAEQDLERKPPRPAPDVESTAEEDEDQGLPYPDPELVRRWWGERAGSLPAGMRFFMGAPVSIENCREVLRTGYQRQRMLAAQNLCLLTPGTPLFNTSAPAWRQSRMLARNP
jgi:uncharacterized protein (TIGR02270 family)